jgi:hypothetical protein
MFALVDRPAADAASASENGATGTPGALAELLTLAVSLVIGVVVMPCVIFLVGHLTLGEYAHGGVFAFWRDFVSGLAHGSEAFWFVALAPYLLLWLARAGRRLLQT